MTWAATVYGHRNPTNLPHIYVTDTVTTVTATTSPVDGLLALVAGGAAVQAFVLVSAEGQEFLHHVQHADELAENQHLCRTKATEKVVQNATADVTQGRS